MQACEIKLTLNGQVRISRVWSKRTGQEVLMHEAETMLRPGDTAELVWEGTCIESMNR